MLLDFSIIRFVSSITDSGVPVNSGGACGGFLKACGAIVEVVSGRVEEMAGRRLVLAP